MQVDLFGNPIQSGQCRVLLRQNALCVITPYDPRFVAMIKSLPMHARRFDPSDKAWLVDTQYGGQIKQWIRQVYGEDVNIPSPQHRPATETRVLDVWYLGRTKPAGDEYAASGMNQKGQWIFVFPESVLREWFEGIRSATNAATLYGVLGVRRNASDEEIKSAYRRMVRQWHPDVCKEPNAAEMFIRIREAYELLSDPMKRARYDAGLALEASLRDNTKPVSLGYRSPLRCGYVLAEGSERIGRFVVSKILRWEDIVSDQGTLVASWPQGSDKPVWQWV